MGLYSGGLIIGGFFAFENQIWEGLFLGGLIFGGAYYQNFTVFSGVFILSQLATNQM